MSTRGAGLARTIALVAGVPMLVDVWQIALRVPGALSRSALVGLLAVYVAAAAAGCAGVFASRRRGAARHLGGPRARWLVALWVLVALGALGATGGFRRVAPPGPRAPGAARTGSDDRRPNVLLVVLDAVRADHVSCYGYARPTTPFLDALAAGGVLFTRAIAQSSWTKPAVASLLTARLPTMHGATSGRARIPDVETLLAELLRAQGYRTALFSANPWVSPGYGFAQGTDDVYLAPSMRGWSATLVMMALRRANRLVDPQVRFTERLRRRLRRGATTTERDDDVVAHALEWLDAEQEPFFLYVHLVSPHAPYDPPPPFARAFDDDPAGPVVTEPPPKPPGLLRRAPALPPAARRDLVARYDGSIAYADTLVRRLVERLRARGVADDTIVVVTADHGEELYDHGSWGHGQSLYQELIHVPLIVAYPARLRRGVRIDRLVMSVDVMPTILALAQVAAPAGIAGQSLLPLVDGGGAGWPDEAYAEVRRGEAWARAVLEGDRKLVEIDDGDQRRVQRFDLATDAAERRDRGPAAAADPLATRLRAIHAWAAGAASPAAAGEESPETARALRALGYLEDGGDVPRGR